MPSALDPFIPEPDVGERHETTIRAPAPLVMAVARDYDLRSNLPVRIIFRLRELLLRSQAAERRARGLVAETQSIGWGALVDEPGRLYVAGAVCQPWRSDVVFTPLPPQHFADFDEPEQVKIAWTIEAQALAPALTRFATETRVVATDDVARAKFRRYWRLFGIGIVAIRWVLVPAVRRKAEQQHRAAPGPTAS